VPFRRPGLAATPRQAADVRPSRSLRRLCLLLALATSLTPGTAVGQNRDEGTKAQAGSRTRFASFDIGFGAVKPVDASWGLSYGVAFDVANLLVRGASMRFGFRFWTSDDDAFDSRVVDLDDSVFDIMLKKQFGPESLGAYAGLGIGAHVVNARFADRFEEQEARDGFHVGLDGVLGAQKSLADNGFISLFLETQGSLVSEVSQVIFHAGIRIRFDRLGTGG
jgi:hypothetical protein